jgi:ABC-2 type transport system ATP-binding protein
MITTTALTKRFGPVLAVDAVDLDVRTGDIYGFLGANGSGKTTTVRLLLGLVLATSGEISLLGEPMPRSARRVLPRVGALVEGPAAYGHLPGRANLMLYDASGRSHRRRSRRTRAARVDEVLAAVGLDGVGRRAVRAYSLGMRQRLGLAAALLSDAELLVLDEPTNGLDPQGIREIRELILRLHAAGTTVFLSSHLLAEVEQMCTRVGLLDGGRLVLQDDLDALRRPTGRTIVRTPDAAAAVALLDGRVELREGDRLVVQSSDPASLNALLVDRGVRVTELVAERRTLEQVILEVTNPKAAR